MKEKGITLIALVVTIIILVILAAISINLILNGKLINRAEVGQKLTELSKKNANIKVYVVPTNEELMIARDTLELIG